MNGHFNAVLFSCCIAVALSASTGDADACEALRASRACLKANSQPEPTVRVGAPCAEILRGHIDTPFYWRATVGGSAQCCTARGPARDTNTSVCLPHANVVGFPKAGTTAFHGALLLHPSIYEGYSKELALHWEALKPGSSPSARRRLITNLLRPRRPGAPAPGASDIMLNSDPNAHEGDRLRLLSRLVPNARVLFILRDPAERALSALLHKHRSSTLRHKRAGKASLYPENLTAVVEHLIRSTEDASGALCLARGIADEDAAPALATAALLQDPTHLPKCLKDRVVPCSDPRAETGDRAMAVWPLHARRPPDGMLFYLAPILEALKLFGSRQVDVRWLESFRADPAAHIVNVSRFLGLTPIDRPPRTEAELTAAMRNSKGSVAQLVQTAWSSVNDNNTSYLVGDRHELVEPLAKLSAFFLPFERAYNAWTAHTSCAEQSPPRKVAALASDSIS